MTGVEWMLLLIGAVFMVGSFFVTEKLSPAELTQIAELSEKELKKIIEQGLDNARGRIDDQIEEQLDASMEIVDRALEKETNNKIMAINDYSDTVLESMNKTHNEIMFLYSMLNDKHTELTGMVSDLQHLSADVRSLEENFQAQTRRTVPKSAATAMQTKTMAVSSAPTASVKTAPTVPKAAATAPKAAATTNADTVKADEKLSKKPQVMKEQQEEVQKAAEQESVQQQILALHRKGLTEVQIARKLGMGIGEVRLVIGLYKGE